jgi:hypothetical protein
MISYPFLVLRIKAVFLSLSLSVTNIVRKEGRKEINDDTEGENILMKRENKLEIRWKNHRGIRSDEN